MLENAIDKTFPITPYYPQGLQQAKFILDRAKKFFIYYDPDIDGGTSGELFRRYAFNTGIRYEVYINENRQHGFKLTEEKINYIKQNEFTIVMVDATCNNEDLLMLINRGISIVVIDHHDISEENLIALQNPQLDSYAVVINNQYPFEPEEMRYLSGCGMVYHVVNYLTDFVEYKQDNDTKLLVGLSLLSDIRPLENPYAKEFLNALYYHDSPMTEYMIKNTIGDHDFGFGVPKLDRNYIDYTLSPKINALFRMNKGYDAIAFFMGEYYNEGQLEVYREEQNRICSIILDNMERKEYSNLIVGSIKYDDFADSEVNITNLIGLACSKVVDSKKTAIVFVEKDGQIMRGSLRGLCDDVAYNEILNQNGFDARGHKNACGIVSVDYDKLDLERINSIISEQEQGYMERLYTGRILDVVSLSHFMESGQKEVAIYNNYVRDVNRIYIRYIGSPSMVEVERRGKAINYHVDGLVVNCFDDKLNVFNALIQPVFSRRRYVDFYLKPY